MNTPKRLFPKLDRPARVIVLMSGSGSNAEVLIRASHMENSPFTVCALLTDRPERCRAREIAAMYHLPLVECDIFDFYRKNGESSIRLDTPHRRELRNLWNAELEKAIEPFAPDFGADVSSELCSRKLPPSVISCIFVLAGIRLHSLHRGQT